MGNRIGGAYEDDIVSDLTYTIPRDPVFLGAFYGKDMLMLGDDKSKDASTGKVKLNIAYTTKATTCADVYDLLFAKLGEGDGITAHIKELCK